MLTFTLLCVQCATILIEIKESRRRTIVKFLRFFYNFSAVVKFNKNIFKIYFVVTSVTTTTTAVCECRHHYFSCHIRTYAHIQQ